MSLCNCTMNGKNTLLSSSLSMTSPVLSERASYFMQLHGRSVTVERLCSGIPSLQTSYKGLAGELLECRNGCAVQESGWGCLEKVCSLPRISQLI